jgi:hypothetical protein
MKSMKSATHALAALAALALASLAGGARAHADETLMETSAPAHMRADRVESGEHWRLDSGNGIVHVWRPAGYDPRTAGTVVYLHGHRSSADESFIQFGMATQFHNSGLNALFIVPDSTTDGEEGLHWDSLGALLRYVARETGVERGPGSLVVMGHSGAFRNIVAWLDDREIDDLILLDALYSYEDEFRSWILSSRNAEKKRLTLVSRDTRRNALRFMRGISWSVGVLKIPESYAKLNKRQRDARILNLRSQYEHMDIVTSGRVIPLVLQRSRLRPLGAPMPPTPVVTTAAVSVPR